MIGYIRLRPRGEPLPPPLWGLSDVEWQMIYALARWREEVGALTEFPGYRTLADASDELAPPRMRFARWLADEGRISG